GVKAPRRVELPMDLLHQLAAEEVAAAVPLVAEGGVVEKRLDQEHFLPKETTKVLHGVEDSPEEAQAAAYLTGGEPRPEGPLLLVEVPGDRPEQGVLAVAVPVDGEAVPRRVGDLDERQLGNRERAHLHVDEEERVPIVRRGPDLHARPRLIGGSRDAQEALPPRAFARSGIDPEAIEEP